MPKSHIPLLIKCLGHRWIHDYQEACVDKLERFMRGEFNTKQSDVGGSVGPHRFGLPPHGLPPTPGAQNIRSPSQQRRSCSVDNVRQPPPLISPNQPPTTATTEST